MGLATQSLIVLLATSGIPVSADHHQKDGSGPYGQVLLAPFEDEFAEISQQSESEIAALLVVPRFEPTPPDLTNPWVDGRIDEGEYDRPLKIDFSKDENPGIFIFLPGRSVPVDDIQAELFVTHDDQSLYFAFRVVDDFIDAQPEDSLQPNLNDGIELFIDGDCTPNDFRNGPLKGRIDASNYEGFQLLVDAAGNKLTVSHDFDDSAWKAASRQTEDGYIIEIEIPLELIDTVDGGAYRSASSGSLIRINAVINDNDELVSRQTAYGDVWTLPDPGYRGPYMSSEPGWPLGLYLEPGSAEDR